jgi:predicted DNA-binding WGR domain protein
MPINPNIALAVKPIEVANPLNAYAQMQQIRGAQQQNALAQMQMQEYERARGEEERLRNYLADKPDLTSAENQASLLTQFGKTGRETLKSLGEFQKAQTDEAARKAKLLEDELKRSKTYLEGVSTPEQFIEWHMANHANPILGKELASRGITPESSRARIEQAMRTPGGFEKLLQESKLGVEKYTERTTLTEADRQRIKQEGQRIGLEGRRVAVMEDENRRAKDPVFQQKMAAAKATGEAIAKNEVAAKQALPGVIANAQEAVNLVDQLVGKQEVRDKSGKVLQAATAPHAGFENAVGTTWKPGFRFIPGTDAADFQALFEQVKGSAFLEAFNTLKGAGAITEKEGEKATAARTRMSTAQSEAEFVKAAREYQDVIRKGVEVMQKKASGGAAPAMPAGAGGAVDMNNPLLGGPR